MLLKLHCPKLLVSHEALNSAKLSSGDDTVPNLLTITCKRINCQSLSKYSELNV